jgi:hypothetical protein
VNAFTDDIWSLSGSSGHKNSDVCLTHKNTHNILNQRVTSKDNALLIKDLTQLRRDVVQLCGMSNGSSCRFHFSGQDGFTNG